MVSSGGRSPIPLLPVSQQARRLEAEGFENQGVFQGDALLSEFSGEGVCYPADDREGLKRLRRLSGKRWARWFFTDEAGHPVLICAAPWDRY